MVTTLGNFNFDPTIAEMRTYLKAIYNPDDITDMEVDEAIYWFAHDHNEGPTTHMHSAMALSKFKPNAYSTGLPDDSTTLEMYCQLLERFT